MATRMLFLETPGALATSIAKKEISGVLQGVAFTSLEERNEISI
jgi:hypothetical protein